MPWLISSSLAGLMTSRKSHTQYVPTGNTVNHSLLKMDLCSMEKPSSSLHQKGRRSLVLYAAHTKALPKHSCLPVAVSFGLVCMRFLAQNAATPLTPTPTPSHPWKIRASDILTLDGLDYLILADFYSKVILVGNLPAGQRNSAKVIHILEEWFCDHGTPEFLCTDIGPQYASAVFTDCNIEWGFTHETSSPHYQQSSGFAESCVKKSSIHYSVPSTVVQIQGLHYSTLRPPWLMPNFPHPLRCCTTARHVPPYHLGPTILTQQPYRFKSTLRMGPSMPSPMLISTPSNLHHSMLVSQLPHLTP